MKIASGILGVIWALGGLSFFVLGVGEGVGFFIIFGGIIAVSSGSSVLFLLLQQDKAAWICAIVAAVATVPIGIIYGIVAGLAMKAAKDKTEQVGLDAAMKHAMRGTHPHSTQPPPAPPAPQYNASVVPASISENPTEAAEKELIKLKQAHAEGVLDDREFAAKKKEIDAKVDQHNIQLIVRERKLKLKNALDEGILEQGEYEGKVSSLETTVRKEVEKSREEQERNEQLRKLKIAYDQGVLTHDQYQAKVNNLGAVSPHSPRPPAT